MNTNFLLFCDEIPAFVEQKERIGKQAYALSRAFEQYSLFFAVKVGYVHLGSTTPFTPRYLIQIDRKDCCTSIPLCVLGQDKGDLFSRIRLSLLDTKSRLSHMGCFFCMGELRSIVSGEVEGFEELYQLSLLEDGGGVF